MQVWRTHCGIPLSVCYCVWGGEQHWLFGSRFKVARETIKRAEWWWEDFCSVQFRLAYVSVPGLTSDYIGMSPISSFSLNVTSGNRHSLDPIITLAWTKVTNSIVPLFLSLLIFFFFFVLYPTTLFQVCLKPKVRPHPPSLLYIWTAGHMFLTNAYLCTTSNEANFRN